MRSKLHASPGLRLRRATNVRIDQIKYIGKESNSLEKLVAWNLDPDNEFRDAVCISRTWVAQAKLLKEMGAPMTSLSP
jgi:hypothetical protein